jgi:ribosomal protein S18 acetylase RimI-like enzyme
MHVTIDQFTIQDVANREEQLVNAYRAMYALPLASSFGFEGTLREHARREGFRLCVAQDPEDDALVGFGYGFTGQAGQAWRDSLALALDQPTRDQWLTDYFELAEFGVIPAFQRQGIGGRLHDRLLADLPHPRSVLTVRANNEAAKQFYRRRGWLTLHEGFFSTSGRGPYIVMGLTLARTPAQ